MTISTAALTGDTITTRAIRAFAAEAAAAGDAAAVELCDRCLDKSIPTQQMMSARQVVADMITAARAQDDE
jgi:hypothetical protein